MEPGEALLEPPEILPSAATEPQPLAALFRTSVPGFGGGRERQKKAIGIQVLSEWFLQSKANRDAFQGNVKWFLQQVG